MFHSSAACIDFSLIAKPPFTSLLLEAVTSSPILLFIPLLFPSEGGDNGGDRYCHCVLTSWCFVLSRHCGRRHKREKERERGVRRASDEYLMTIASWKIKPRSRCSSGRLETPVNPLVVMNYRQHVFPFVASREACMVAEIIPRCTSAPINLEATAGVPAYPSAEERRTYFPRLWCCSPYMQ